MNIHEDIDNIEIRVDRRTTLLGIIEIISNYKYKYPRLIKRIGNEEYIKQIEENYNCFQNNEIIVLFNKLLEKYDFSFSTPIKLFLQLNYDFSIETINENLLNNKFNGDKRVIEFLQLLPKFASEINFDKFYFNNQSRFKKYIQNIKSQLYDKNILNFINDYLGVKCDKKFVINLIPWRTYGCYGTNDNSSIYNHLCCHHKAIDDDTIYPPDDRLFDYSSFSVHEFSHSFVNPIVDKYNLISESDDIFSNIFEELSSVGYGSNDSILKDHIVRSITLRYLSMYRDNSSYNKQYVMDKEFGFEYIDYILKELINYENNRSSYNNFESFYPALIDNLKTAIKSDKNYLNK